MGTSTRHQGVPDSSMMLSKLSLRGRMSFLSGQPLPPLLSTSSPKIARLSIPFFRPQIHPALLLAPPMTALIFGLCSKAVLNTINGCSWLTARGHVGSTRSDSLPIRKGRCLLRNGRATIRHPQIMARLVSATLRETLVGITTARVRSVARCRRQTK